ncbi:MAG: SLC13 family permease [Bacteroidales bacterium]|nr:SLC13 family permease [Bacteroidales bacterium]
MSPELITIAVIIGAVILFVTDKVSVDIVGLLIISALVLTGVVTPEEGVRGFSNKATITVAFMFILSAALLKTGALQMLAHKLAPVFRDNFSKGMLLMMILIAVMSAFVNNTPVVAVFIPVVIQIGHASGRSPSKMLIPLSFASIFGGTCTLIGTSTNILVSGIAEKAGLPSIDMFQPLRYGIFVLVIGILYMLFFGIKLLPKRSMNEDLGNKFGIRDYLSEIELLENAEDAGKSIMNSDLVRDLSMDVLEVRRNGTRYTFPPGDFVLRVGDILKVNCSMDKMKRLKSRARVNVQSAMRIGGEDVKGKNSTLVEMVVTADSEFAGKNLRMVDFRRRYRAVPLAVRSREDVKHEDLYDIKLQAGDGCSPKIQWSTLRRKSLQWS